MEYYNEMRIEMKNRKMANQAFAIVRDTIRNTSIAEDCKGQFAEFYNSLTVKEDAVIIDGIVSVYIDSFESLITEICNALANYLPDCEFKGFASYMETYETTVIEFKYSCNNLHLESKKTENQKVYKYRYND